MNAAAAIGIDLGRRAVDYDERDAILYALAVGAPATRLDLVFERDLRVLPTFGLALGLWAPDALGARGLFDVAQALHGAQRLELFEPLPPAGRLELTARVANVWDKGGAAVFEVEVGCRQFRATYAIFAPGSGGFGGERGPSAARDPERAPDAVGSAQTNPDQAALYRLTGDRHLIHIDPAAARAIGQPRPILHGLCTLGVVVRALAALRGAHPCDLAELSVRFSAPVLPGETIALRTWEPDGDDGPLRFAAATERGDVLSGGAVRFA
ncbi:MaoC/PaaZ C-terminal domain-containing protein [Conexibacter sp. JD483]|nr:MULTISPECIES: MaoC/PaaZ C-terminal domain-containing protein [unclassified Conexibacter]MDO8186810.1 MaoC/PaaZ C-terminal domain-containing protein [Conexibacter sp. CPCC 205706]MDO8197436.1 MaoC/PaaZ C-terminal domain-containing protein [Conexibacter sp. CPCC 205762]MDR9370451.1 MaoC/PaaZ C-terminal domain-containing protein [Conexibacter sp. JD483]